MNQEKNPDKIKTLPAWLPAIIVFALALAARLVYLYLYHRSGYWDIMTLDPETHDLLARRMASGMGLGDRAYFRAPLYIYILGIIYKIFGPGYMVPRIIQALLGSASACIIYLIARKMLPQAAAFIVGLSASIYWVFIYFDGELLVDGLAIFFALLVVYFLVSELHKKNIGAFVTGLLLGLAAISRANFMLFAAAVVFFIIVPKPTRRLGLILLVGLIIPVTPVTVRNILKADDMVLISSQGGINFYMGNNPDADGRTAVVPIPRRKMPSGFLARFKHDPWFKEDVWLSSVYGAEQALGRPVKESRVSSYWYIRSMRWMTRHPIAFSKLMLKKIYFLLNRAEVSNNRDLYYHLQQIPFLKALSKLHFGIICPLFILGLAFSMTRLRKGTPPKPHGEGGISPPKPPGEGGWFWLDLFVVTYGISVILFFVNSRYRLPIIPAALILAGLALSRMAAWVREKEKIKPAAGVAVIIILAWIANTELVHWNSRPLRTAMRYNLGLAFSRAQRFEEAAGEFRAAVEIKDEFPEAHLALGNALALSGRESEAINEYHIAIIQEPGMAEAHYNMGLTYRRMKDFERAKKHFRYAHELAPEIFPDPGEPGGVRPGKE